MQKNSWTQKIFTQSCRQKKRTDTVSETDTVSRDIWIANKNTTSKKRFSFD